MTEKPKNKPTCLNFSSGPCTKRPGWSVDVLKEALVGRSHRSSEGKLKLNKAIEDTKELLSIPSDYKVGIVPASDTGALEMAMWNLLGARPVEVLSWEVFGKDWKIDIEEQLKTNIAKNIRIKGRENKLPETISVQELDTIFQYLNNRKDKNIKRDTAIIEILYGCGTRISELVNLNISDINISESVIRCIGKGQKER